MIKAPTKKNSTTSICDLTGKKMANVLKFNTALID